jgi:hypothetical protein
MIWHKNNLYATGPFYVAGATPARSLAKWTGTEWQSLRDPNTHGVDGQVEDVAVAPDGTRYIGGFFMQAGGAVANSIAKWNGRGWEALGNGILGGGVNAVAVGIHGEVYAGGSFTKAGDVNARNIAMWNGTSWEALGDDSTNGADNYVRSLAVAANGDLYIGGSFRSVGGISARFIARWDGTAWSAVATSGLVSPAEDIAIDNSGNIYVATTYYSGGIVKLEGSTWVPLGDGVNGYANAVDVYGNDVYVGGFFSRAGDTLAANSIARWDGTKWCRLGGRYDNGVTRQGIIGYVTALDIDPDGNVFIGGSFTNAGNVEAMRVAWYDGTNWHGMFEGVDKDVFGIAHDANNVYFAGAFTYAGSVAANSFAVWQQRPTGVEESIVNLPKQTILEQNYPNPFNPVTVISYRLQGKSYVSLKVYNILGEEVATIVDGVQEAGYKSVEWDATSVASGVYMYQLKTDETSEVKKMVVLR